jgi:Holliday junction resolvasome RuvABC endonuclease subunit
MSRKRQLIPKSNNRYDRSRLSLVTVEPSLNGSCFLNFYDEKLIKGVVFTAETTPQEGNYKINNAEIKVIRSNKRGPERVLIIRRAFREFLNISTPCYIAIEDYSFGSRSNSYYDIGELGWMFRSEFLDNKIPYRTYTPFEIKDYTTGVRKAPKSMMVAACLTKWENHNFSIFEKSGEDLDDAYCIGRMLMTE